MKPSPTVTRIGVLSDTHGNLPLMRAVVAMMLDKFRVDAIYHLGDNYADSAELETHHLRVLNVPGLYCQEYTSHLIPKKIWDHVGGLAIVMAHARQDLTDDDTAKADVILCGHTHAYEALRRGKRLFVNPGHLKAETHKDRPATFGIVEIADGKAHAKILNLEGNVVTEA
ncbi:MAG: metallophosphoesterase family protein [Planctomycetes bacterium]|nr:metallophosphoesterase family protein [Planctomycetota bacterium]MBM4080651.1 metallophosphoesterase family protein [Planctomycetota bacterium]MBM4083810.1 metallophosphoesterase family protein [Planctomycetota bacterium]